MIPKPTCINYEKNILRFSVLRGVTALKGRSLVDGWRAVGKCLRRVNILAISTEISTHDVNDGSDFRQTDPFPTGILAFV